MFLASLTTQSILSLSSLTSTREHFTSATQMEFCCVRFWKAAALLGAVKLALEDFEDIGGFV